MPVVLAGVAVELQLGDLGEREALRLGRADAGVGRQLAAGEGGSGGGDSDGNRGDGLDVVVHVEFLSNLRRFIRY